MQHQPRLQLEQRGDQHDELGRGLEVELAARFEVVEVGQHDLGQLQLEQVDLFAQHERQQQVERAAEDLEVQLERGQAHGCTGRTARSLGAHPRTVSERSLDAVAVTAPTWRADAHPLAHVGERLGGDRARALGAVGEDRLERALVGAQLLVALAHGREVVDHARPRRLP